MTLTALLSEDTSVNLWAEPLAGCYVLRRDRMSAESPSTAVGGNEPQIDGARARRSLRRSCYDGNRRPSNSPSLGGPNRPRPVAALAQASVAVVWIALAAAGCRDGKRSAPLAESRGATPAGEPKVWVVDDGVRVAQKSGLVAAMSGSGNPVWSPGGPVRLFALPGETVAMQVVVTAGSQPLSGVTVELGWHKGASADGGPAVSGARPPLAVERFVVHELDLKRRSGGRTAGESLGWAAGSAPPNPAAASRLPDPLIGVEHAPSWADYPMSVPAGEHRVVWLDIALGRHDLPARRHLGEIAVQMAAPQGDGSRVELARIGVELDVGPVALPYAPLRTMVYFDPEEITGRTAAPAAVGLHQQLMHRHHLSTIVPIRSARDVQVHREALQGTLYTPARGYHGPGQGVGADVVAIGAYGSLRAPTAERLAQVDAILAELAALGIEDQPGVRDVFLYAVDEQCESDRGPKWRAALASSSSARLQKLRVAHTCSDPPAAQPVDLVMMFASKYDPALVEAARAAGKRVWIYNGVLPFTGSFLTDGWWLSLRANAWIQARYRIERWFYWESTFWNDDNRGGQGPYDPLTRAETFHNTDGDRCNGDGVLVYPGRQPGSSWRSVGAAGVLPSMRLKQWRRGIQDAGYLELARRVDAARAEQVARTIVPAALQQAKPGGRPPWPVEGAPYFEARRQLFDIIRRSGD